MKDNKVIKLSDIEHILLRPFMYIGSIDEIESEEFILNENNIFELKTITYVPGLLKIINEIIDNSVDEAIRTKFKYANKIKITITDNSVEVIDNGRGIPVIPLNENSKEYMPVVAFTHPRAGANFDDNQRDTIGMNGIGATATNIFSTFFMVKTADGKKQLHLKCKNNLKEHKFTIKDSSSNFTHVYFEPDLSRFNLNKITDSIKLLIKQRLVCLSLMYPQIRFIFNNEKIGFKNTKDFLKAFSNVYELYENKDYFIAVLPNQSDDFKFFSIINGLYIKDGGTHVDFILNEIVSFIKEKINKNKNYNILYGDIKNKLMLVVFFKSFTNMKFDSQTKEKLTNNVNEIKNYLNKDNYLNSFAYNNFLNKIIKNENIINPIIENYQIKEEMKKRKELNKLIKNNKYLNIEKYVPPIKEKQYLVIGEGDSAVGGLMKILGRKGFGYYTLKGKPLNTLEVSVKKLLENKEYVDLIKILEIDMNNPTSISYDNVLIATDQDLDGIHIRGLLLAFFYKYTPQLIKQHKIKFLNTPIIIIFNKNTQKPYKYFFTIDDYNNYRKKNDINEYEIVYYKGLGTFEGPELKSIIEKEGFEKFIESVEMDEYTSNLIQEWLSKGDSDKRKENLRGMSFDLFKL